jgi:transposase-like protein
MTNTERALQLIDAGKTVRQAAREVDISESALHAAVKKRKAEQLKEQGICPCCHQSLPDKQPLTSP